MARAEEDYKRNALELLDQLKILLNKGSYFKTIKVEYDLRELLNQLYNLDLERESM